MRHRIYLTLGAEANDALRDEAARRGLPVAEIVREAVYDALGIGHLGEGWAESDLPGAAVCAWAMFRKDNPK